MFRVPAVLTANKGTIADPNGLPAETAFTWQWVRVDGMTETDISGATAQTYTLVAADVGKTIQVKASFTDTGTTPNTEGPLTSAAYPTIGTVTAAATCTAPTYTGGATQIWTGKVAVTQIILTGIPGGFRGFASQALILAGLSLTARNIAGELSNTALAAGSSYTIKVAGVEAEPFPGYLFFGTTSRMSDADQKQLTLYVCDEVFPFQNGAIDARGEILVWVETDLDWRDHAERTLYISRDQAAPTVESLNVTGTTLTLTFNEDMARLYAKCG